MKTDQRFFAGGHISPLGIALVLALLVSGCASSAGIGPKSSVLEPASVGLMPASAGALAPAVSTDWWRAWGDASLSDLIEQTLQAQPSLKAAQARLRRAQAATSGEEAADG